MQNQSSIKRSGLTLKVTSTNKNIATKNWHSKSDDLKVKSKKIKDDWILKQKNIINEIAQGTGLITIAYGICQWKNGRRQIRYFY